MTTSGGQKLGPNRPAGAAAKPPQGRRVGLATTETFGRFVRNLAKLEGGAAGKGRKTKEGGR